MSRPYKFVSSLAKSLYYYLEYIWFEIIFFIVGGFGILDDIVLKHKNKCAILNKTGEVAIVTGGARGIGVGVVKKLLQCDMTVIIGCRNIDSGLKSIQSIRNDGITSGKTFVYKLDLECMESVKKFASEILKNFKYINVLINNAGVMFGPYKETVDGFESQLAINYLSHFYLTHLLMPLLDKCETSRVINVTSCAYVAGKQLYFDNMNMKKNYIPSAAYAQSKLCQILFTKKLDRHLREINSNVYILAVHPGIVNTDLFNGTPLKILFPWVLKYFCKDIESASTTILAPCISPVFERKGGIYLSNCCIKTTSKQSQDILNQEKLFDYSLKVLNISKFGE